MLRLSTHFAYFTYFSTFVFFKHHKIILSKIHGKLSVFVVSFRRHSMFLNAKLFLLQNNQQNVIAHFVYLKLLIVHCFSQTSSCNYFNLIVDVLKTKFYLYLREHFQCRKIGNFQHRLFISLKKKRLQICQQISESSIYFSNIQGSLRYVM